MYNYRRNTVLKKIIERFRDLHYRKRLKKWFAVNIKFIWRKLVRFITSEQFRRGIVCTPAVMTYVSVVIITALSVGLGFFVKHACPHFNEDAITLRELSVGEGAGDAAYMKTLDMLGSSNRIQIKLRTDNEPRFERVGKDLDRGNINMLLTFSDDTQAEYSLSDTRYDNFEAGMTDTFTVELPDGKTNYSFYEAWDSEQIVSVTAGTYDVHE